MAAHTLEQLEISPLKLWSPLQRQLAACGQVRGSRQQWVGIVRNLQKKGVSTAEIEWSEILPILESWPRPGLHIHELLEILSTRPPCELQLQRLITDEFAPDVRYVKCQFPAEMPPAVIRRGQRVIRLPHYQDRSFGLCVWLNIEVDKGLFGRHRYWSLSVPRGRKHPLRLETEKGFGTATDAMAHGRKLVQRMAQRLRSQGFVGPATGFNLFTRYVLPSGQRYTEWLITGPNLPVDYWGPHFAIHNLVAHVRTTERTTPHGARMLLLEEIQSDWNQALREAERKVRQTENLEEVAPDWLPEGEDMEPAPPPNPYRHHWLEAALRMMLLLAAHKGFAGIAWLPGQLHVERFPWANGAGLAGFYDRIVPMAVDKLGRSWGAGLETVQFDTVSRHFRTKPVSRDGAWCVVDSGTGKVVADGFAGYTEAEEVRLAREVNVMESVTALCISDAMRADLVNNGLPCLGNVGRRL